MVTPPAFSAEVEKEIVRLYVDEHLTAPEIKARLGSRSVTTIYSVLNRHGISRSAETRHTRLESASIAEEVVRLYRDEELTGPQIKARLGVPFVSLYRMLQDAGIYASRSGRRERIVNALTDGQRQEIVALFDQGVGRNALAEQFRVTPFTIRNTLRRKGVGPRHPRVFLSQEQIDDIVKRYTAGESQQHIANELGLRQTYVSHIIHREGASKNPWKQGRITLPGGYIGVMVSSDSPFASMRHSNGYAMEHRLIVAGQLGRPLGRWESVHHIDGDRSNNDPANLQLRQGAHGAGVVHRCLSCGSFDIQATPIAETAEKTPPLLVARALAGHSVPVDGLIEELVEHYPEMAEAALKERGLL